MLRLGWLTIDTLDVARQVAFWTALLGYDELFEGALVPPPGTGTGILLYPDGVDTPKRGKNRVHLDLASRDQGATVARALELGATHVDVGQGEDVPWVVLADPEGNEFCVLGDRQPPALPGRGERDVWIDAVVLDVPSADRAARFWGDLLGWDEHDRDVDLVVLRDPTGKRDDLAFVDVRAEKRGKNRVHPDLVRSDDDLGPEVRRAVDLGATPADIGQGDVPWAVLADPAGNEFCILAPRELD